MLGGTVAYSCAIELFTQDAAIATAVAESATTATASTKRGGLCVFLFEQLVLLLDELHERRIESVDHDRSRGVQIETYGFGFDQLLMSRLVLLLDADILFVQSEHARFDVLWHVLAR